MDSEVDRYTASTPKSAELQAEAERYLPGGSSRGTAYFAPYPFFVERADGHHVVDVDGNRYLDFMLNATTYVLGHSNDRVVEAVREIRRRTASATARRTSLKYGWQRHCASGCHRSKRYGSRTRAPREH